ncbi:hypothetical protein K501DRAFT_287140 [Backusella circina FSU 941]|nr:hypothetical protein K501DRAFT_287140 [Backusella circina FSU 941]
MFKFITVAFFALIAVASALVINPKISTPNAATKWRAGESYTVKWDTTFFNGEEEQDIPDNYSGALKLGYLVGNDLNEHLYWDLASGFKLNSGSQTITLPDDLETKRDYIIVLMGNSGNASPRFFIQASK